MSNNTFWITYVIINSLLLGYTSFNGCSRPPDLCPLMVKDTSKLVVSINWTYTLVCTYTHTDNGGSLKLLEIWYIQAYISLQWETERASVSSSAMEGPHPRLESWQLAMEWSARRSGSMITQYITGSHPQAFIRPSWTRIVESYTYKHKDSYRKT